MDVKQTASYLTMSVQWVHREAPRLGLRPYRWCPEPWPAGSGRQGGQLSPRADPRYAAVVLRHLREITGMPLHTAGDLVEATADTGVFVQLSGVLKRTAVKELRLPPRQAGSSIMPGKVNPVVPEVVNLVAFWVVGNDVTITMAAEAGQLQLNAFEPIMCHGLLPSMDWMTRAFHTLARLCVRDIEVTEAHLAQVSAHSVGVVTALIPQLGYAEASAIAKAALSGEGDVRTLVLRPGLSTRRDWTSCSTRSGSPECRRRLSRGQARN